MSVEKKNEVFSDWIIGFRTRLYSSVVKGMEFVAELLRAELSASSAAISDREENENVPSFEVLAKLCGNNGKPDILSGCVDEMCGAVLAARYRELKITAYISAPIYRGDKLSAFITLLYTDASLLSDGERGSALCEAARALTLSYSDKGLCSAANNAANSFENKSPDFTKLFDGVDLGSEFVRQSAMPFYIIDDDYNIRFYNKALATEYHNLRQGEKCYKALMEADEPCFLCPLKKLENDKSSAVTQLTDSRERIIVVTVDTLRLEEKLMYGISVKRMNGNSFEKNSDIISQFLYDNVYNGVLCGYWEAGIPFYMINKPMLEYLGYGSAREFREAVDGLTINVVHPDDRERVAREMNSQLSDFREYSTTMRMIKKDGSTVWARSRGRSVSDKTGKNIVVGIFTDISELISANERLDKLVNTIPGAVVTFSVDDGRLTVEYCSEGISQILGISTEEYVKRFSDGFDNLIYPPDRAHVNEVFEICRKTWETHSASYRVVGIDGKLVWIRAFCRRVDEHGEKSVFNAVLNNLSMLERSYVQLLDTTASPIRISDVRNGQLLYANKAMYRCVGVDEDIADDIKRVSVLSENDTHCDGCTDDSGGRGTDTLLAEINGRTYDVQRYEIEWNGRSACVEHMSDVTDVTEATKRAEALTDQLGQREQALAAALRHAGLRYWEYEYNSSRAIRYNLNSDGDSDVITDFPEVLLSKGTIHKDDCESYRNAAMAVRNGADNVEWSGRYVVDEKGGYVWRRLRYSQIYDKNGKPVKAMVTSEDIDAFKELEERMNNLLDQHNIASWHYDILGGRCCNVRSRNPAMSARLENMSIPPKNNEGGMSFVHPDDVARVAKFYEKARNGEKTYSTQLRIRAGLPNEYSWFEYVFTNVFGDDGKPIYALCSSSDIGALKQLEKQYADEVMFRCKHFADDILNSRVNITENRVVSLLMNGVNIFTGDYEKLTDYRERMGLCLCDIELSDADNAYLSVDNLHMLYKSGTGEVRREYMARLKSTGQLCHISVICRLLLQPQTENLMAFFYNRDDTESYMGRLVTQTIIESDFNMCAVLLLKTEELMIIRSDHHRGGSDRRLTFTMFVKDIYARMIDSTGYDDGDMLTVERLEQLLRENNEFHHEMYVRGANDEKRLIQITYRYADREKGIVAFFIRDIHDFMQSELEKKRQLMNALNEAKKANAAKSDFLSRMSHDMRTPMNAVLGLTHLSENENSVSKLHDNLRQIQLSGSFLLNLINDTLDMSKIESGVLALHPIVCSGEEVFENIIAMMQPLMNSRNVRFEYKLDSLDGKYFLIDPQRVEQIIVNFLSNSAKFTPSGGTVTLSMKRLAESLGSERYSFGVCDTGIGMSKEFLQHVFEPFAQEHRAETEAIGGTGLGMPIAKQLIELMGGTLDLKSEYGKGTDIFFELELPLAEKPENRADADEVNMDILRGKCVLLCEDNAINEIIATELLAKKGVQVESAVNGKLGVQKLEESAERYYDAVLMDIRMPVMDGLEAARAMRCLSRADARDIPIIAMTANAFDDDVNSSLAAGMNAHIAKPIDPEKLYNTLIATILSAHSEIKE